ncbi:hypothetical protein PVK06_025421 [Gossypium arboreum]|uniref:RNase H type-1 domain-containing protein n=1 Tax=Gossypium arboreum TaxID=29729 RepID=A0ABR0PGN0_GOSAR|nr:hypothetical protein PVK06_025421 [Gossypium arboreum]
MAQFVNHDLMVVRVLQAKYDMRDQLPESISKCYSSHLWKSLSKIVSIPPPHPSSGSDKIIWTPTAFGSFSVRRAFWSLKENSWNAKDVFWKNTSKQRLLTNSERSKRGIDHNSSCPVCGCEIEDTLHAAMANTWVNLFADGTIVNADGSVSIGGVLRDQHGNWILEFNHFLGRCSVFKAELKGILDSLLVMLSKCFKRVTI